MLEKISIITIYDNYLSVRQAGKANTNPHLKTGWGFSCLIHCSLMRDKDKSNKEKNILFDTGADSETLLSNMKKLTISPEQIDTVFLSHNHYDHTGGLEGFLTANKKRVKIIKPTAFYKPTKISDETYSTGALGDWIKEQSLFIKTKKGLVIITGCSHPGIIKIIKTVKNFINEKVYLVLGGFHLAGASDFELKSIIDNFRKLDVQKVAPCHCSGDNCRELFRQEYKDDFIENGVGEIIEI